MAIAPAPPSPSSQVLSYEQYLAEGEVACRYDIIDGVRIFDVPGPTFPHQEIAMNIAERLRVYQRATGRGRTAVAPLDVIVSRDPLRTRQPDVLFITHERLAQNEGGAESGALTVAPELVVEVLSPSDTHPVRQAKIADFRRIGVRECWLVDRDAESVEVLRLTLEGTESAGTYGRDQTLQSDSFPDLTIPVADIFAV